MRGKSHHKQRLSATCEAQLDHDFRQRELVMICMMDLRCTHNISISVKYLTYFIQCCIDLPSKQHFIEAQHFWGKDLIKE
jgi:hypothetical protein